MNPVELRVNPRVNYECEVVGVGDLEYRLSEEKKNRPEMTSQASQPALGGVQETPTAQSSRATTKREPSAADENMSLTERFTDLIQYVERGMDPNNRLSRKSVNMLMDKIIRPAFAQASLLGKNNN